MARPSDRINSALSKHNYQQIRKIGEGSFGAAILVQHEKERDKDSKAIVKMIDISRATRQEKEDALKESKVLASLKHPYIVRYRESFNEDGWLCIVMDYCEGGDLSERIKRMRQSGRSFPQEQVLRWFTQAILALKYIHDQHILHRDLKSGNFFLSKSGNIKMGDFGIAKVLECTAACAQTQIGTPYYLSPEICQGKSYAWGSDIWSMGCILYEMCAKRVPFEAPDLKGLIKKITSGSPPELPGEYSAPLRALCKDLLDRDASKRPHAAEILKRPVVQEMVRKMLDEVKEEEPSEVSRASAGGSANSAAAGAAAPQRSAASGNGRDAAGTYSRGQAVEYYSETHGEWLPAQITNVDQDGRVMLNVKPNVWLSLEVQGAKVRPRQGQAPEPPAPPPVPPPLGLRAPSSGAPGRPPAQPGPPLPGSPGRPGVQRQASERRDMPRNTSRERLFEAPRPAPLGGNRLPSPRREVGTPLAAAMLKRGPSQDRIAGRGATPQRGAGQAAGQASPAGRPSRGGLILG